MGVGGGEDEDGGRTRAGANLTRDEGEEVEECVDVRAGLVLGEEGKPFGSCTARRVRVGQWG